MVPATTGSGDAEIENSRSAPLFARVVVVALLLPGVGSVVADEVVAVAVRVELLTTVRSTLATTVKVAVPPEASDALVKLTVPVPPTGGVVANHAPGAAAETKVVLAGSGRVTVGDTAVLGPLLVSTIM